MVKFQIRSEGCRAVSCRAVSPIRFFDPILNNALALRASHNVPKFTIPDASGRVRTPKMGSQPDASVGRPVSRTAVEKNAPA